MKRSNVLQLAVILVGMVMGFLTLQYVLSSLYAVFLWLFDNGNSMMSPMLTIFAVAGLQALFCWLLITRSRQIAAFIQERSGLKAGMRIISHPNDLLYLLLITLGIYLLLSNISPLLSAVVESFSEKAAPRMLDQFADQRPVKWVPLLLEVILPLVLLMAARPIADYFARNISEEPVRIEEDAVLYDNEEND